VYAICRVLQVLGRMKQAMVEHSSSASHSFLLDDDSTLPFVANDILAQMDDKVRATVFSCIG
jgi:myosin-5